MRSIEFTRLAPSGSGIELATLFDLFAERHPDRSLREAIRERLSANDVTFHASGREAMRVALCHVAEQTGRHEIIVPAYCCFSIPAAAVAAGLGVRLVDIDLQGHIDFGALAELPVERAGAIVITNLFGRPEPLEHIAALARRHGAMTIDDAAQTFGARANDGYVGGRSQLGVLSFGRAKPLSALGGGAVVWHGARCEQHVPPVPSSAGRLGALLRAIFYNLARAPLVFRLLSTVPQLNIGTTEFDPSFKRGAIEDWSLCLAAALVNSVDSTNRARSDIAERMALEISARTAFEPLMAQPGSTAVYPRLGLLAPDYESRDAALRRLCSLGATAMYPTALNQIDALRAHLVGEVSVPGAEEFCRRLITLPVHQGLNSHRREMLIQSLQELS